MRYETILINDRAKLTTYLLDDTSELKVSKRPAILVFPGGGYMMVSDREAEQIALMYNNAGFNAFVLRYTVNQGFPEAYKDAISAIEFIDERREEYHINKLMVCGFSAGAHLACSISTLGETKPDGMILIYPPLIQAEWQGMCPSAIDLLDKVNEKTPKAFIVHCVDDPIVPVHNTYLLMQKLDEAGIEFESHVFPKGGHGFSTFTRPIGGGNPDYDNNRASIWCKLVIEWIKESIGADVEFVPSKKVPLEEVPDALMHTVRELIKVKEIADILNIEQPFLLNSKYLERIMDVRLGELLATYMETSKEYLESLASKIEPYMEK